MKTSKKVISLLLSVIMVMTCFAVAVPQLTIEADAQFETINGITQSYVVPEDTRESVYASYAAAYLNGYSEPTDLLIPGLSQDDNYVVQGMAYYPEKNWALITAYHNSDSPSPSMVYCIDIATGDFVAMFSFVNVDGTPNTDHGGGIAISEHNIYYSCGDMDRSIAYAPLSAIEGIENDTTKYRTVQLVAEQTFYEIGSVTEVNEENVDNGGVDSAYTAYVCYDQGVLWTGNFYNDGVLGLIAADYNIKAHDKYPSMVWGYKLSGSTPEEEWANLASNTQNCQGNPSYVIALPGEEIIDVQYATVDDGRLYLSRSYGTGTETSINAGMSAYSQLSIADIDLTVPGTGEITFTIDANGTQKTVNNAYIFSSSQIKTFDFMPMSEGLCVIDDYVYMTFESACYKYYKDAGIMGNCDMPIDVVWRIDQYGLLSHERPDEKDVTAYQKVMDVSEIKSTDEYIVVYESEMRAEGNQNNILYALDSYGGYKGDRLPKTDAGTIANTLDSMGMIGHEITDYHKYTNANGQEFLVFGNPEKDDEPNIRWNLIGAGTGSMRLHSVSLYNASYSYLYFDSRLIYMSTLGNTNLDNISLVNKELDGTEYPGEFWIYNSESNSYLWCNDGSDSKIMEAYNTYYSSGNSSAQKFANQEEIPGTFHTDARKLTSTNSGNLSSALPEPYTLSTFNIYKRVTVDPETMGGTGLETDLKAELQSDGTYTINMGTYATSEAHKYLGESGYPTDFMFVLDASGSMTNNTDYVTYQNQGNLAISRGMANNDEGYYVYVDEYIDDNGVAQPVNQFCNLDGHYSGFLINVKYWVGAVATDGNEYFLSTDGKFYWRDSQITKVSGSDTTITQSLPVYRKVTTTRLQGMKDTVNDFITKIDANAQTYNIEHRVGIATFGSDADESYLNTGIYSTLSGTTLNQYTAEGIDASHYAAAFYPSNHSNLHTIVNAIDTTTGDPDTFANYGMDMAVNAYAQQSPAFGGAGDRYYADWTDENDILHEKNANAVLIFLTDGCPGYGGSDSTTATTVANAAIPTSGLIKANGGVVYSVQVSDATMDGFDMAAYMNGVSSNYPSATTLTTLGTQASSDYYVKAATDGSVDVGMALDGVFEHIEENYIDVGTAITLDEDSIVRQKLGSNFKLTDESSVTLTTSDIKEDVLGNVIFEGNTDATDVTYSMDVTNNTIQVTNFDYSSNYYDKNAKEGKRLNIIIDKVLPVDNDEDTMNISNATYTAIYENAANMNDTTAGAGGKKFKGYPNAAFEIPEYTYVLDYGMPMQDTDINGTLCAVSEGLTKQNTKSYNKSIKNDMIKISGDNLDLIYSVGTTQSQKDKGYVLINRDDGTYDWFKINVVPASNVLYEESALKIGDNPTTNYQWKPVGGSAITTQDLSTENDVYGFDNNYASSTKFSNGTHYYTTVDSSTKKSDVASFTFTGTGFDLISACGPNTGVQMVVVKQNGTTVKAYIVDTYYDDAEDRTALLDEDGLMYQVPIVNFSSTYGTYTVETKGYYISGAGAVKNQKSTKKSNLIDTGLTMNSAKFDSNAEIEKILAKEGIDSEDVELVWFDDNSVLNGGTGVAPTKNGSRAGFGTNVTLHNYIDGIRVYNPLGTDSSNYIETEKNVRYGTIIDNLADSSVSGAVSGFGEGIAYITGTLPDSTDENGDIVTDENGNPVKEALSLANYESFGPKNELYLEGNMTTDDQYLTFPLLLRANERVMLGLRAVNGATTIDITSVTASGTAGTKIEGVEINSATELYYDITETLPASVIESGDTVFITIKNTGSGILAVNTLKLSGAADENTALPIPRSVTRSSVATETTDATSSALFTVNEADLSLIQSSLAQEGVPGVVINGVVTPVYEETTPEDNTNTDTENDNTNDGADTEESENEEFSLFSLIEMLIAFIEKILYNAFGAGSIA